MTQQFEQRSFDKRQEAEAEDFKTGRDQKIQFTSLVDKLSALKLVLRFQEDNRETENAFKLSIRHKRAAFQVQLARLEKRQIAERYTQVYLFRKMEVNILIIERNLWLLKLVWHKPRLPSVPLKS
jgi:hypothetical protein